MQFIIDCSKLADLVKETAGVYVREVSSETATACQNCRSSCDSWCTALCASSSTK